MPFRTSTTRNSSWVARISAIGHFYSALPGTLALDPQLTNGGIFQTDVTGDGTVGDPAPGTVLGDYMHKVNGGNLQSFITNFNATQAGKLTGPVNNSSSSVTGLNNFGTQAAGRTLRGSGTFDQGAPRSAEFGLKLTF